MNLRVATLPWIAGERNSVLGGSEALPGDSEGASSSVTAQTAATAPLDDEAARAAVAFKVHP